MWTSDDDERAIPFEFNDMTGHPIPARIGRYVICGISGAGAMGVVYRAHDPELNRAVAIKLVRAGASDSDKARLFREAQAMAQLRHPNVVPIFDVGLVPGGVFLAMALLDGGTLREWVNWERPSLNAILDKFIAAGRGLAAAHSAGIVHRDFKPDNVLLDADGVFVGDFGLALLTNRSDATHSNNGLVHSNTLTQSGQIMGTPAYMSPEQLRGEHVDARTDQFSFCVALWEAVYDQPPFEEPADRSAEPVAALFAAIAAGPVLPTRTDRPKWLARLLTRGLAANPDGRWPTLHALLDEIAAQRTAAALRRRVAGVTGMLVIAATAIAIAVAAAVAHAPVVRPEPAPQLHRTSSLSWGDLTAAISPDGRHFAIIVGDTLVLHDIASGRRDRLIDHGMFLLPPLRWSPDGKRILAGIKPDPAGQLQAAVVDVDHRTWFRVPAKGAATFLSNEELAVAAFRDRSITFFPAVEHARAAATCAVDGDYTLLQSLAGMADGTTIVETQKEHTHALVVLRHDCKVQARFSVDWISSFAISDTGTIIAIVSGEGSGELLEVSLHGKVLSQRSIGGDVDEVLGRRGGVDYLATRLQKTHLDRVGLKGSTQGLPSPTHDLPSVEGNASFSLAPDGDTMAWVALSSHTRERGRLLLSSLRSELRDPHQLRDDALRVAWSPEGERLAVLVDDRRSPAVVIIRWDGTELQRLPLDRLARESAPVWLDDHRILAQSDDWSTYRWFDLITGEQGNIMDSKHGGTYWLSARARDGMIAVWRNGLPGAANAKHLWLQERGGEPVPFHVNDAVSELLSPSWSPSGELFVRALGTGVVSRVALGTKKLTPVAQLPRMPLGQQYDTRLMFAANGDLLAPDVELGMDLWEETVPDDARKAAPPVEPSLNL